MSQPETETHFSLAHISAMNLAGSHAGMLMSLKMMSCWLREGVGVESKGSEMFKWARDNGPKWKVVVKSKYTHHFQVNSTKPTSGRTNYICVWSTPPARQVCGRPIIIGGRLRRIFTWTPPAKQPCSLTLSHSNLNNQPRVKGAARTPETDTSAKLKTRQSSRHQSDN